MDTTMNANLKAKIWAKDLWFEAQKENFFAKFTSSESPTAEKAAVNALNSIVHQKEDLTKQKGDSITFGIAMKLTGAGVTGDNTLEGEEEAMDFYDFLVKVGQIRHAVRIEGAMEEQASAFNMRNAAKSGLKIWLTEMMDKAIFTELGTSPTANRVLYGGTGITQDSDLAATDVLTTGLISRAKRKAKMSSPKIRPVMVKGKAYYVLLAHPYQLKSLRAETDWKNAQQNAGVRGDENKIFSGMEGIWDGVIIHEHENVPSFANWGAGAVTGARALFLGAQAAVVAIAKKPFWVEKSFDYLNKTGFATGLIWKAAKTKFNDEDYGVISIDTGIQVD